MASEKMSLERAFRIFCDLGCRTFQGVRVRVIGMDQTKWRKFNRLTKLCHGHYKERDVAVVFANVRYPGSSVIDFEQFKIALQIVAIKRKIPPEAIREYILKCAESLNEVEDLTVTGVGGRSMAMNHVKHFGAQRPPLRGQKMLVSTLATSTSSHSQNLPVASGGGMGGSSSSSTGSTLMIKAVINTNISPDGNTGAIGGTTQVRVVPSKKAPVLPAGPSFSLTDYLMEREKKTKATGEIDTINQSLKEGVSLQNLPPDWDTNPAAKKGPSKMLNSKVEEWDWA